VDRGRNGRFVVHGSGSFLVIPAYRRHRQCRPRLLGRFMLGVIRHLRQKMAFKPRAATRLQLDNGRSPRLFGCSGAFSL